MIADPVFARRSTLREWLRDHGFDPDQVLDFGDTQLSFSERQSPG